MPTGYTHAVQNGEITTLREFAIRCARGFGACVTMRDDLTDAPIPERFEPQTRYHDEHLAEARQILAEIPALSADECDRRSAAEHADALDSHRGYLRDKQVYRERYEAMIAQVEAWAVPDDLAELRQFMLDQLRQSVDFDCDTKYVSPEPPRLSAEAWRAAKIEKATKDYTYHTAERQKEIERTDGRNRWLATLRASLP